MVCMPCRPLGAQVVGGCGQVRVVLETTGVADTITGPSRAADFRKELSEYTREVLRGHGGPHLFEGKDEQVVAAHACARICARACVRANACARMHAYPHVCVC